MDTTGAAWFDSEIAGCSLADERLKTRLGKLLAQLGGAMGQSIPLGCQDWANTMAAYRFFSNERVNEADVLAGHFQSTRDRVAASDGPIFVLHDTTEFTYKRENPEAIGITGRVFVGRDQAASKRDAMNVRLMDGRLETLPMLLSPDAESECYRPADFDRLIEIAGEGWVFQQIGENALLEAQPDFVSWPHE